MKNSDFTLRGRIFLEALEDKTLSLFAARSSEWYNTRIYKEPEHPYRTAFQRDRDRIIHSRAFRRLKHKRQVFLTHSGDHYRTRLTHTLEVAQLSRTISKAIGLNEELVEAIALGHDLGHTPFGHVGEIVLNRIMSGEDDLDKVIGSENLGGFKHNYQSVRVVDNIEKKYNWNGLNLTAAVREGILKHTRLLRPSISYPNLALDGLNYDLDHAVTLEGQVVAVCDEIAQRTHDLEDGIRAGYVDLFKIRTVPLVKAVEEKLDLESMLNKDPHQYRNLIIRGLINLLTTDVIETTLQNVKDFQQRKKRLNYFDEELVRFSEEIDPLQSELDIFIATEIISHASTDRSDTRAEEIIRGLFKIFCLWPHLLPDYVLSRIGLPELTKKICRNNTLDNGLANKNANLRSNPKFIRAVCDHIAGMTDNYAENEMARLQEIIGHKI